MAYREAKDVMLYFRSVADEDNDDGTEAAATNLTSLLIPAKRLRWMNPTSDTLLTLYFDSIKNTEGADNQADEITIADEVTLTVNTNASALNPKLYTEPGIDVVALTDPLVGK